MSYRLILIAAALLLPAAGCYAQSDPSAEAPQRSDNGPAPAQPMPAADADPDATPQVVQWLDKLEARGREIRNLQANLVYRKVNTLLLDEQIRTGALLYVAATPEEPARFAIDFTSLIVNDTVKPDQTTWIFDGQWLVEKQPAQKLFIKRQVVAPGKRLDPLAVDGPFPLPLGQKRDDVLRRFHVELAPTDKAGLVHLKLTPRNQNESQFRGVDMWIDRESLLPVEVTTLDESENQTRVQISKPRVNELAPEDVGKRFDTTSPAPGSGWRVETTTFED